MNFHSELQIGCTISWNDDFKDRINNGHTDKEHTDDEVFPLIIDLILNCACFVYIGAWLPLDSFNSPDLGIVPWRLCVLFMAIIFLRRIPAILILYRWIPEIPSPRNALFLGHFGEIFSCLACEMQLLIATDRSSEFNELESFYSHPYIDGR